MEVELIKNILELGSAGVLAWWVYSLRKDLRDVRIHVMKKEDEHKTDLKTHNTEIQSLFQNVVGENMSLLKVMESVIREFKRENKI